MSWLERGTSMTPRQNPGFPTRLQVGAVVGVVVLVVVGVWTLSSQTSPGTSPSPSAGIGLASQLPGTSGSGSLAPSVSLAPGASLAPGTSAGVSPAANGTPAAGKTPAPTTKPAVTPTPKPTPKPTPTPTPKPVTAIKLASAYSGFSHPIFVTGAHDGTNRLFVVEQSGHIRVIVKGKTQSADFLNISGLINFDGAEQGLLGLAFNPSFKTNGYFYVYYNQANGGNAGNIIIARYTALHGTNVANAGSAKLMINPIPHTQFPNHNGGDMAFGPNGLLYFGTGDGGSGGNPTGTSQSQSSYLGKMLRINVNSATPITPTIWAYGLRNPWRWSFDSATGDMWIGDVGQDRYEEIDHVSRAQVLSSTKINFGWNVWEGRSCYPSGTSCSSHGVTMPVAVYDHSLGCAVIGGYVYRGPVAGLRGNYFYSDDCSGRIWRLVAKTGNQTGVQVANTGLNVTSFGTDDAGNEYVVAANGTIYRIGL
jgi:glucose/arabinose dehydrogenase